MSKNKQRVPAAHLRLTPEQRAHFKTNINMALLLAHLADGFFVRAEEVLKEAGNWELDLREQWKHAINKIRKVTLYTDATLDRDEAAFYADLKFIDDLMLTLIERIDDNEKQDKVLNMIKCMNL